MARMTQMNVRVDAQLKDAVDDVLARLGMTSSQAVRILWEYIATHEAMPQLDTGAIAAADEEDGIPQTVLEGAGMYSKFLQNLGIENPAPIDYANNREELRNQMYEEKWEDYERNHI